VAKLDNCPTCGNPTSENANTCPSCGEPLDAGWANVRKDYSGKGEERSESADEYNKEKSSRPVTAISDFLVKAFAYLVIFIAISLPVSIVAIYIWDANQYLVQKWLDPKAHSEAVLKLEQEVTQIPVSELDNNIQSYKKLLKMEPDNTKYANKLSHYESLMKMEVEAAAEEEKKWEIAREAQKEAIQIANEAQKKTVQSSNKARKKTMGFHCLRGRDGSHQALTEYVKQHMRDPGSYEHVETRISPVNPNGKHALVMKYRGKNGFGGMSIESVVAAVDNKSCLAQIIKND
jgi:uncharacterized membrane protein YvbJ